MRPLPQALFESLFEICDLYTTSLNEKEYISFARALLRASTVKRDGQLSFRHRWPAGAADGAFLSRGIVAMQQYIEKAVVVSAATGAANYGSTKKSSDSWKLDQEPAEGGRDEQWRKPAVGSPRDGARARPHSAFASTFGEEHAAPLDVHLHAGTAL